MAIGVAVVAAFPTIRDLSPCPAKIPVAGWDTTLGKEIGFYFGARSTAG